MGLGVICSSALTDVLPGVDLADGVAAVTHLSTMLAPVGAAEGQQDLQPVSVCCGGHFIDNSFIASLFVLISFNKCLCGRQIFKSKLITTSCIFTRI